MKKLILQLNIIVIALLSLICIVSCSKADKLKISVESISLTSDNTELKVGADLLIKVQILPSNASNKDVHWISSDNEIASVDNLGKVHALKDGKCTITAISNENKAKTASLKITIVKENKPDEKISVESISITTVKKDLKVGESLNLETKILPVNATNKEITWKSSNAEIATVDNTGTVNAVKVGECTISVISNENKAKTASLKISVSEVSKPDEKIAVESISITTAKKDLKVGDFFNLETKILPENASNTKVNWTSSNTEIASVDNAGKVHANKIGNVKIVVITEDGNKKAEFDLSIVEDIVPIKSISIKYAGGMIRKGDIVSLQVIILPENTTDKSLTWESSNSLIATVDKEGKVNFIGDGEVYITAKSSNKITVGVIKLETTVGVICSIPDANFKRALLNYWVSNSEKLDSNRDGEISVAEAEKIKHLHVFEKNISNLTGIEYFVNLKSLNCYNNKLRVLNVTKCKELVDLRCGMNNLESIDLSKCTKLKHLNIYRNPLKSIDLSNNPDITFLNFWQCQELKSLDLSNCRELKNIDCSCNNLEILNISNCTKIKTLECTFSKISELNVSKCALLEELNINNSVVKTLDLSSSTELKQLLVAGCGLKSLNLATNTKLTTLRCSVNKLKELDLSMCTQLTSCFCNGNMIEDKIYVHDISLIEQDMKKPKAERQFDKDDNVKWMEK